MLKYLQLNIKIGIYTLKLQEINLVPNFFIFIPINLLLIWNFKEK